MHQIRQPPIRQFLPSNIQTHSFWFALYDERNGQHRLAHIILVWCGVVHCISTLAHHALELNWISYSPNSVHDTNVHTHRQINKRVTFTVSFIAIYLFVRTIDFFLLFFSFHFIWSERIVTRSEQKAQISCKQQQQYYVRHLICTASQCSRRCFAKAFHFDILVVVVFLLIICVSMCMKSEYGR